MFEMLPLENVVRIANAGGGFTMNANLKQTEDLVRIASAASRHHARVTFTGLQLRPLEDLIRISSAGDGSVVFAE